MNYRPWLAFALILLLVLAVGYGFYWLVCFISPESGMVVNGE